MKKTFWDKYRRCAAMVCIVFLTFLTLSDFYSDIMGSAESVIENNLSGDAEIFTMYYDDMINERFVNLNQISKSIGKTILDDASATREVLDEYKALFGDLLILDTAGQKLFGDDVSIGLSDDELEMLAYDRQICVHSEIVENADGKQSIALCRPVEYDGKVQGILVGTLHITSIQTFLSKWSKLKNGSVFLMTDEGKFIVGDDNFEDIFGNGARSYYNYLSDCNLNDDEMNTATLASKLYKSQPAAFSYSAGGEYYASVLEPSEYSDWHMGYVENIEDFGQAGIKLSKSSVVKGIVCLAVWGIALIYFLWFGHKYNTYRDGIERYRVLQKQERSVLFEFQFTPKRLQFFGDMEALFGYKSHVFLGEEVYDIYQYVHEDDASVRGRIHKFYDDENSVFSAEIRIRNADGVYGWYRITGSLVKNIKYGTNQRFLGKIESADQQIADEKNLLQRAENDLLTGILNKKTLEGKMVDALQHMDGNYHYIFFMVDLDNFKNVNDNLGHIMGDKAIVDTAQKLSEIFPNNAFIGRLGGDEFAVCVAYDAFDEESLHDYIGRKSEKICEVNRRTYVNGDKQVSISSSVGVAVAPDHATDWETLYKKADSALYRSKNGGKNCYHICDEK
ncbi:MAG: diguanylate cyclase [Clostridiaceae bacterium]|nr:diguanylate cyclase [Clostridiaceae bacterium]